MKLNICVEPMNFLSARMQTFDACIALLNAKSKEHSQQFAVDIAWELQQELDKLATLDLLNQNKSKTTT
jgi:hypothetical protein